MTSQLSHVNRDKYIAMIFNLQRFINETFLNSGRKLF